MTYDWFRLLDLNEFIVSGLVSISRDFTFPNIGTKTILFTSGNLYSLLYEDVFLSLALNDKLPFYFDDHAVFCDEDNFIWLGIKHED